MTTNSNAEMDRRAFIKALAATAVAAATVGGGAGLLSNKVRQSPVVTTTTSPPPAPPAYAVAETVTTANTEVADLLAQLASAQADNMRLRAELDAAQRRVTSLETSSGDVGDMNQTLQTELAAANQEVSLLAGLVALYDQLDDGQLLATVEGSLANFGEALGGLLDEIPSVEEGLAMGAQALDQFEARLPALTYGRNWLETHMSRLNAFYEAAETILDNVTDSAGVFLQKVEAWFQSVRKWLPFGVGNRAAEVMSTLTRLLDETPNTIHGLRRNIADPLDGFVGKPDAGEAPIQAELIRPLKENALKRTGTVVERARTTGDAYQEQVRNPLQQAIDQRRRLREQIEAYRKEHNL